MTQAPLGTVRSFENGQQLHTVPLEVQSQFLDYKSTSYLDGKIL